MESLRRQLLTRDRLYDNWFRQIIFRRKFKVTFVMRGHAHHRAGPIFHQHKIPNPDGNSVAVKWIECVPPDEKSFFLRRGNVSRTGQPLSKPLDASLNFLLSLHAGDQRAKQGMLWRP